MKARKTISAAVVALLVVTIVACGASDGTTTNEVPATTAPRTPDTADEYDVYSTLIQGVYVDAIQPRQIVISTVDPQLLIMRAVTAMKTFWPDLGDDVLGDFRAKNKSSSTLERAFMLSVPYTLMSEQEVASIFSSTTAGWDKFYARYPDAKGLVALSRVGFNQAKDTAVLYTEYQSGASTGEGDVVLMKKTDGRWTVETNSMIWQS